MNIKLFDIVTDPINPEQYRAAVLHAGAGAVTVFTGHVREWTNGIRTLYLEYEAYESMAVKKLAEIGEDVQMRWPGTKIAIAHRIGRLEISDIAVVIAVSSPHRHTAYKANEYAIDQIKKNVPIWKKEIWENGQEWKGDQNRKPTVEGGIS